MLALAGLVGAGFAAGAGFGVRGQWVDAEAGFALSLMQATRRARRRRRKAASETPRVGGVSLAKNRLRRTGSGADGACELSAGPGKT